MVMWLVFLLPYSGKGIVAAPTQESSPQTGTPEEKRLSLTGSPAIPVLRELLLIYFRSYTGSYLLWDSGIHGLHWDSASFKSNLL